MRSDNDTWDITASVGSTALFVAAARALEAQKPAPLAVDPYAEVFCRAVADHVAMLEYSWYSVISPEGCASILWKDPSAKAKAAETAAKTAWQAKVDAWLAG